MSFSSTTNRISYTGNGAVDTYAYTFKVFENSHLLVTVRNTSGVETTLTLTTDYTVTGVGAPGGGNVVLVNSAQAWLDGDGDLLTGYILTIRRVVPITQETDIRNQGAFYPEIHEDEFDKLTMIDLQQQDEVDRSVKLPETLAAASFNPTLPATLNSNPNAVFKINTAGDGFEIGPTTTQISQAEANAIAAAASAAAAAASQTAAGASETAAAASAAAALVSQTAAAGSASSASTSASTATTQASNASTSASNAATSESNAASSALSASTSASTATTQAGNASTSASAASTSASNAATSASNAATSASNAATSESNAAASASSAAAVLASAYYRDVLYKSFADSPITVTSVDNGKLFVFDSSGGAISVTLPQISTMTPPFNIAAIIRTGGNNVTFNRSGTDLIMGATSKVLTTANVGIQLVLDTDASPDEWTVLEFGSVADGSITAAKLNTQVVNGNTEVTAVLADSVLIADASDSGNVKKALISTVKNAVIRSVTTTDTATTADETLLLSGASFTETLFTATGNEGKVLEIIHAGTSLSQVYTIDGNGSETIGGATTVKLHTNGQVLRLRAYNGNWLIVDSKTNTERIAWTPTLTGFGTATNVSGFWERFGKDMIGQVTFTSGTVSATTVSLSLPSGAVIDSAQISISNTTAAAGPMVGRWTVNTANPQRTDAVTATSTSTTLIYAGGPQSSSPLVPVTGSGGFASAAVTAVEFRVPISEWLS